jgi:hypothetical protein
MEPSDILGPIALTVIVAASTWWILRAKPPFVTGDKAASVLDLFDLGSGRKTHRHHHRHHHHNHYH